MSKDFDFITELFKIAGETKEQITKLYVEGKITKDEFIKRMNNAR